ncbi:hypothetical protein GZH47_26485 [Paenibacillus rhizovicinus]|uniref:Uncharacterized protein n=1 Tax=Paenibacillus rhizovicinus TaxID=2704463 RepID=A0A6C0P647_9BACL|nr:hypothetical protein [Paenibacillus rhizovicinus]QHW33989.1 hypothetical protein GZH47_26485 [Paenibacillus rhizovicinus]
MKLNLRKLVAIIAISGVLALVTGCVDRGDTDEFVEISNGLAKNIGQLDDEAGVTLTGFASDPSTNVIQIGIGVDDKLIKPEQLKQIVDAYLENATTFTNEKDASKVLQPIELRIEEIGKVKDNFPVLAEKAAGSTEMTWN